MSNILIFSMIFWLILGQEFRTRHRFAYVVVAIFAAVWGYNSVVVGF